MKIKIKTFRKWVYSLLYFTASSSSSNSIFMIWFVRQDLPCCICEKFFTRIPANLYFPVFSFPKGYLYNSVRNKADTLPNWNSWTFSWMACNMHFSRWLIQHVCAFSCLKNLSRFQRNYQISEISTRITSSSSWDATIWMKLTRGKLHSCVQESTQRNKKLLKTSLCQKWKRLQWTHNLSGKWKQFAIWLIHTWELSPKLSKI